MLYRQVTNEASDTTTEIPKQKQDEQNFKAEEKHRTSNENEKHHTIIINEENNNIE